MSNRAPESQIPPFVPALVLLGVLVVVLALLTPQPPPQAANPATLPPTTVALQPTTLPPTPTAQAAQSAAYDPALIKDGQTVFQSVCFACHGIDARGIPGLGKNLVESQFVHGLTDEELLAFVIKGRDTSDPLNTTGVAMPPRGGNPSLTDDQLRAVIAYVHTLSDSASVNPAAPTTVVVATTVPLTTPILPTSIPVTPQAFTAKNAYAWSCAGCHGADGKGNGVFGPSFTTSGLMTNRAELLYFLTHGNPLADPRTEFPHPARGGYPELTDQQLFDLIDYVISLSGH